MKIETELFGELEIDKADIIQFPEGLLAFEDYKEFVLLNLKESPFFKWLQAVQEPDLGFLLTNPFQFFPEYEFDLSGKDERLLEIKSQEDVLTLTIVTMNSSDVSKMTTNLLGPILLNLKEKKAKQLILADNKYSTKEPLTKQTQKDNEAGVKEACR